MPGQHLAAEALVGKATPVACAGKCLVVSGFRIPLPSKALRFLLNLRVHYR